MADNDLSVNTVKVGEIGVADHVEGSDKFLMSRPGDGEDSDVTYTAEANGIYAGAAESDPVVNKIYEIAKEPATRTVVGAVKPGIGLDVRTDGTLDNTVLNKNLLFCGDDLTMGQLYDPDSNTPHNPSGLELPMGMYYTMTQSGMGPGAASSNANNNLPNEEYEENDTPSYKNSFSLGSVRGVGFGNDETYTDSSVSNGGGTIRLEAGVAAPVSAKAIRHLVKWGYRGLYINNPNGRATSFETISLGKVSAMRDVDTPVLDVNHRSITVTFKVVDNWQSMGPDHTKYFTCILDASQQQVQATLFDYNDPTVKLGQIGIWSLGASTFDRNHITGQHTGAVNSHLGSIERCLYWKIGAESYISTDYGCNYTAFMNGAAWVVGIKVEYGTRFTGFDTEDYTNFSSKENLLNQTIEYAAENAVYKLAKEARDGTIISSGAEKFTPILFHKKREPKVIHKDTYHESSSYNFQHQLNIDSALKNDPKSPYYTGKGFDWYVEEQDSDPGTGHNYIYRYFPPYPSGTGKMENPYTVGAEIRAQQSMESSDSCGMETFNPSLEGFPTTGECGNSNYNRLTMADRMKIADQYAPGEITINGDNFALSSRKIQISNGEYEIAKTEDIDPDQEGTDIISYYWKPRLAPIFQTVNDVLTLKPATNATLGGVSIASVSGINNYSGHISINCGRNLSIDTSDNTLNADFTSNIDDTTTASDKTWSSNKINTELGKKQATLNAGSNITLTPQQDGTVTIASSGGGGGGGASIDDTTTALDKTWSSSKINTELGKKQANLNAGSNITLTPQSDGTVTIASSGGGGASIDDTTTALDKTWSSNKINTELSGKQGSLTAGTGISISSNVISASLWTDVTGTLTAGSTTLTLSDAAITTSSTIEVFCSVDNIPEPTKTVTTGSITLTFAEAQLSNMNVKVRVS